MAVEAVLQTGDAASLARYRAAHSRLPGPRGNLELAHALADIAAGCRGNRLAWIWTTNLEWTRLEERAAPENTPEAFLPFCGALVLGAIAAAHPKRARAAFARLRACAPTSGSASCARRSGTL
ncbi:MAG: hypothetical protein QN178_07850 [Armatimonadota bacterium]|nr:hypothetical protein [Armatimonadota bacterium]